MVAAVASVAVASCTPTAAPPAPTPQPAPPRRRRQPSRHRRRFPARGPEQPTETIIRVGLVVGAAGATIAGSAGLSVSDPSGARLAEIPAGEVWRIAVSGTGLVAMAPGGAASAPRKWSRSRRPVLTRSSR